MGAVALLREQFADPAYRERFAIQRKDLGAELDAADERLLDTHLLADPDKVRLRVYETCSTHKSMSALRQGSWAMVADQDFHEIEEAFHEAVFTHASTSPNLQIIASLDVARRQMELEGYELVQNAITLALQIRREVNSHPLIAKYFKVLTAADMVPAEFRGLGLRRLPGAGRHLGQCARRAEGRRVRARPDPPHAWSAARPATTGPFKNLLAAKYDIQLNKTSRNSILPDQHQHAERRRLT